MSALRQKFRPKHQVLILKCYPRFQRNNVDVKPNSSELSYLLFYASSRRSKLPKVGAFLEKKTASDIYRNRQGYDCATLNLLVCFLSDIPYRNAQVTLQVLKALIEKCARDLPIFSNYVLHILHDVLKSHQVGLLEHSTQTFEAFCNHYDPAQFAADDEHIRQYEEIINIYALIASRKPPRTVKQPTSANLAVRHRSAGMQAIKSLVTADSFAADNGRQLRTIMPAILENIYSESAGHLDRLRNRENAKQDREKEQVLNAKRSTAGTRTEDSTEDEPANEFETTEDADERADEDVGIQALQTLRQIFSTDVPGQLRTATQCTALFMKDRNSADHAPKSGKSPSTTGLEHWAKDMFEFLCRLTSVQNRFVVLVTLTDALTKSPIVEEDLSNQFLLVRLIGSLLRSDIAFIGLSVNDVLIGFINHILLLLQLGGPGSGVRPHRQQTIANDLLDVPKELSRDQSPASGSSPETEKVGLVSELRIQLLDELSVAIGDLATHVYYADQISEMVAALLLRLKPPLNVVPTTADAIEDPSGTVGAIADSGRLREDSRTDDYFSFDTARVLALNAIRHIIETANNQRKDAQASSSRNQIGVAIWDGTQWLLRDPRGKVRRAYVDALLTWVVFELDQSSLRVAQDQHNKRSAKPDSHPNDGTAIAKRALSNASKRSLPNLRTQSTFLQLLHLAIYENALHYAESEADILLLHLLLVSMVQKLGVNSVRHGLPMIFRLQEDIPTIESITAKDAIGSLVHGYFWALSEVFDFDNSTVGRDISNEISRRSQFGIWLSPIGVPALPLDRINEPPDTPPGPRPTSASQQKHSLQPLLRRDEIIECIRSSYATSLLSPPSSPSSPSITPRRPLSPRASTTKTPTLVVPVENQLPKDVYDQLFQPWSRERCIADAGKKLARSSSLTGSKSCSGSGRGRKGAHLAAHDATISAGPSPEPPRSHNTSDVDVSRPRSHGSVSSRSPPNRSSASAPMLGTGRNSVRVNDLKRILETGQPPRFEHYRVSQAGRWSDVDSESFLSADASAE